MRANFSRDFGRRLLPVLNGEPQGDVRTMLAERDSIIALLARDDPASAGTLTGVLVRLRETVHRAALDSSNVSGAL